MNPYKILLDAQEDVDLGGIDVSYQRLKKGLMSFTVEKAERRQTADNDFILVSMKTNSDTMATDGDKLAAGFTTTATLGLKPFEGQAMKDVDKRLGRWVQAAELGKVSKAQFLENPNMLAGKVIPIEVGVYTSPSSGEERNRFTPSVKRA